MANTQQTNNRRTYAQAVKRPEQQSELQATEMSTDQLLRMLLVKMERQEYMMQDIQQSVLKIEDSNKAAVPKKKRNG